MTLTASAPALLGHPLLRALTGLGLPTSDYIVFGSGPLLAHGLRRTLGDLDVVATGDAWSQLAACCRPQPAPSGQGHTINLTIEVADRWLPGWDTTRLLASAELHAGIPFAPLAAVAASKLQTGRAKDARDLDLIAAHLGEVVRP